MKKLLATTALALVTGIPAIAQTDDTATMPTSPYIEGVQNGVRASNFIGKRVYLTEGDTAGMSATAMAEADANWQDGGEISDMIISLGGDAEAVLVDFGGFLGIGEKTVALDVNQLVMVPDADSPDDYFIVFKGTKEELESAPAFNPEMVFEADSESASADGSTADTVATNDTGLTDEAASEGTAATDGTMATDGTAATDGAMATDGTATTDGTAAADGAAAGSTDGTATTDGTAADGAAAADGTAITDSATATDSTAATGTEATGTAATGATGSMVDLSSWTEGDLVGQRVYGPNDEDIGEISAVSMDADGKIAGAIVDVGGFLGIGEKRVALTSDMITMAPGADGDRFRVTATQEQLEALPVYSE